LEYPEDLSKRLHYGGNCRAQFATVRKVVSVDIYLETSASNWSATLNQPSGTITERMAGESQPELFVNREIFNQLWAARELEFGRKDGQAQGSER